ncbi:hypothetical protein [Bradyrhizobium iriomotense]|uniref:Uncharacterized protein n=1 Tax=Bradyrhizobium iriomotense TaxID=441950 RepID=A0ABQ6AZ24_9BRAD|nr:hypothetical protein [Bradyrhizobium iriomotense]GLR85476.1 hypothetical protein GCM10007857_21870 [Bradyrhizobium iriomotense]
MLIEGSQNPQSTIERYTSVVGLISSAAFRQTVVGASKFETDTAAISKLLVFDTLRANAINDFDIAIEFVAGSSQDCLAAYRVISDQIEQRHARMLEQDVKLLQITIDEYRERSNQLQKWEDARLRVIHDTVPDPEVLKTDLGAIWNQTRENLRKLEATQALVAPTRFPPASEVFSNGPLTGNTVRLSALSGLGILVGVILIGLILEHVTSERRNPKP